ncbi:MAG TPA: hypothetical protein VIG62_14150 [Blastocatellia bacterium]
MASGSPFGKESRVRILKQHIAEAGILTAREAWRFIYQELLWIDGSTGLAHLYESDKAQPGRPWYNRAVVFTDMLCEQFGNITRDELRGQIDKLFRACLEKLVESKGVQAEDKEIAETIIKLESSSEVGEEIVQTIGELEDADKDVYVPDAGLVAEFAAFLVEHGQMSQFRAEGLASELVAKARFYFTVERKRQNVLGEGFEDLLQLLLLKVSRVPVDYIEIRRRADKLPGFQNPNTTRERVEAPDIAVVRNDHTELLASVKWSLRHDRQKQLSDELDCYVDLLSQHSFPKYILITNEYDPGRLVNTDGLNRRGRKIDCIYHLNLGLLLGALQSHERIKDIEPLITTKRLRSVEDFLVEMANQYGQVG